MRTNKSYLHTWYSLRLISKKHNIIDFEIKVDNTLSGLLVKLMFRKQIDDKISLSLFISPDLEDESGNELRLNTCLKYWIPYCLSLLDKIRSNYSICLNASDHGDDIHLSMDGVEFINIIPDEYSMVESEHRFQKHKRIDYDEFYKNWLKRKNLMFWRGSTTGIEKISELSDLKSLKRVRIALKYRDYPGFDIGLTNIVQYDMPKQILRQWLSRQRILYRRVNESVFSKYRYYPDIPGNNLLCGSWGIIRKHLIGSLVFKPNHLRKFYYDRFMFPWEHYIPVREDFADLAEKFQWAENNHDKAINIAWRGFKVANNYLDNISDCFIEAAKPRVEILN